MIGLRYSVGQGWGGKAARTGKYLPGGDEKVGFIPKTSYFSLLRDRITVNTEGWGKLLEQIELRVGLQFSFIIFRGIRLFFFHKIETKGVDLKVKKSIINR